MKTPPTFDGVKASLATLQMVRAYCHVTTLGGRKDFWWDCGGSSSCFMTWNQGVPDEVKALVVPPKAKKTFTHDECVEAIRQILSRAPEITQPEHVAGTRSMETLLGYINKAGFNVEAHQQGMAGTWLIAVPTTTKP